MIRKVRQFFAGRPPRYRKWSGDRALKESMKKVASKRDILAAYLGMDVFDLKDYRYHYGRTSTPVYAIGDEYFCATQMKQKPATHRDEMMVWNWTRVQDDFSEQFGVQIWKHVNQQL